MRHFSIKNQHLFVVMFTIVFMGCRAQQILNKSSDSDSTLPTTFVPFSTSLPDSGLDLTPTLSSDTATSPILNANQTKICTPRTDYDPASFRLAGCLLFQSHTGEIQSINDDKVKCSNVRALSALKSTPVGLSSNPRWFAYYTTITHDEIQNQLNVVDLVTSKTFIVEANDHSNKGTWVGVRWLSNDLIIVPTLIDHAQVELLSIETVDPFAGIWSTTLFDDLPNYVSPYETLSMSPDSSKLLYISTDSGRQSTRLELVLRDLLNQENIWRAALVGHTLQHSGRLDELGAISWAPDNKRVAFSGKIVGSALDTREGLYILDTEMLSLQLVSISEEQFSSSTFHGLTWSPNGRFIAYRFQGRSDDLSLQREEVQLYDTFNNLLFLTCQSSIELAKFSTTSFIWSPDSTQVAFMGEGVFRKEYFIPNVHIIDLTSGKLIEKIAEGRLVGWVGSIP